VPVVANVLKPSALIATIVSADTEWLPPLTNLILPDCPALALVNVIAVVPVVVQLKSLPSARLKLPSFSATKAPPYALSVTNISSDMVTNKFSSIDNAGVVPTAEPLPITRSSALSSNPT